MVPILSTSCFNKFPFIKLIPTVKKHARVEIMISI